MATYDLIPKVGTRKTGAVFIPFPTPTPLRKLVFFAGEDWPVALTALIFLSGHSNYVLKNAWQIAHHSPPTRSSMSERGSQRVT